MNQLDEMDKNYIRTHALRIQDPNISESQKANCKWRIAEFCDFQEKYLDFNRVNTTLTVEQETDVMSIVCLLYTSPSPRDLSTSRMPSSA